MRLLITSDLHFGVMPEGDKSIRELAAKVIDSDADVLVLAGDIGAADCAGFAECLCLFNLFPGLKIALAGNHDVWTKGESRSDEILEKKLPDLAKQQGFHFLDASPAFLGEFAFVGGIGWYDYSFRDESYGFPMQYYRDKLLPGITGWNDRQFVRWPHTDEEFCDKCLARLKADLDAASAKAKRVVACIHHLAFGRMLKRKGDASWDFNNAFMGSERFGKLLLQYPQVELCICGHSHFAVDDRIGTLRIVNPGSDYREKRLLEIELWDSAPIR